MASAVTRVYNGVLGAEHPAGFRSRAPGEGTAGAKPPPPEAEALLVLEHSMEAANLLTFLKFGNAKKSDNFVLSLQKIMGGHETGVAWSKTRRTCAPPPGSSLKSPLHRTTTVGKLESATSMYGIDLYSSLISMWPSTTA